MVRFMKRFFGSPACCGPLAVRCALWLPLANKMLIFIISKLRWQKALYSSLDFLIIPQDGGAPIGLCLWLITGHRAAQGASQVTLVVKNLPANAGDIRDADLIPGSGRSPGEGHGNPLQYFCGENPMDRGAWKTVVHRVAKSRTWLMWLSMHAHRATQTTTTGMWQEWHYCAKSVKIWECLLLQQNLMDLERHVVSWRVGEKNRIQVFNTTSPRVAWGRKAQEMLILFTFNQHRFFSNLFVQSFILCAMLSPSVMSDSLQPHVL